MATPPCMSDDGRQSVFVGTFLQTGDGVTLCDECLPAFMAAVMSRMLGIDPDDLQAAVNNLTGDTPADPTAEAVEVAYPPHLTAAGAPTDEPPAPAPHDDDGGAGNVQPIRAGTGGRTRRDTSAPGPESDQTDKGPPIQSSDRQAAGA